MSFMTIQQRLSHDTWKESMRERVGKVPSLRRVGIHTLELAGGTSAMKTHSKPEGVRMV